MLMWANLVRPQFINIFLWEGHSKLKTTGPQTFQT